MNNKKQFFLSAIIIAKNEEERIGKCIDSIAFADEIIVVDNGSTDKTVEIAKVKGSRVVVEEGNDFSRHRNTGAKEAKGKWILYVDADEIVPEELAREIISVVGLRSSESNPRSTINAYYIRRRNFYLGGEWPKQDQMQRLFLRSSLIRWEGKLHETAEVKGEMGVLTHPLVHDTHRTLAEMVAKTNQWSVIEAQLRFDAHHPSVVPWRLIRVMVTGFSRSFFGEEGWKAGTAGFIESIFQAFSMFVTYAKLWELQKQLTIKN